MGKIKHTAKSVETNDHITDTLIKQLSELMTTLDHVEDGADLEKNLKKLELFRRDVKNILSYFTPNIPFVGLVCGGICLGKHVMRRRQPKEPKGQGTEEE